MTDYTYWSADDTDGYEHWVSDDYQEVVKYAVRNDLMVMEHVYTLDDSYMVHDFRPKTDDDT